MKHLPIALLCMVGLACPDRHAHAQSTALGYQGRLSDTSGPVNGLFDMTFSLFASDTGGMAVAALTHPNVPVDSGLFATTLDFDPDLFDGTPYWLELGVQPAGGTGFQLLAPRQPLTSVPHAAFATKVPDSGLSPNVARLDGNPTFTGTVTVAGELLTRRLLVGTNHTLVGTNVTIGGGSDNTIDRVEHSPAVIGSTIGGGSDNSIKHSDYATIVAGFGNLIAYGDGMTYGPFADPSDFSTIGGGIGNAIMSSSYSSILGGFGNLILTQLWRGGYASIGGGRDNRVMDGALCGSLNGGELNHIGMGNWATIAGGMANTNLGTWGAIVGGFRNRIQACSECDANGHNDGSTIVGGVGNQIFIRAHGSTIVGGKGNTVASDRVYGTVGGGQSNLIQHSYGTIPGGAQARTFNHGQLAYASGQFESVGDAQTSQYVCRGVTTNDLLTPLFLDGLAERMVVPVNSTWAFDAMVTARAADGSSGSYQVKGTIRNNDGATRFAGTPAFSRLGSDDPAWDVVVSADDTYDALMVNVLGAADLPIRWVASVRTVEVTF